MKVFQFTKTGLAVFALAFALLQPSWAGDCPSGNGCTTDSKGNCKCPPGGVRG